MTSPRQGYSSHFGLDNIPFGIASSRAHPSPSCVSRYEDVVVFLSELEDLKHVEGLPDGTFSQRVLNDFAALPHSVHRDVRQRLQQLIQAGLPAHATENITAVTMHLPVDVGDFTDFSCSLDHVLNASEAATGKRRAPPSFFYQPVGYAGRCSSLAISGSSVHRPLGQYWQGRPRQSDVVFGASQKIDYELEVGCIIGRPAPRNQSVTATKAEEHVFGYVLVNDWSARDIQVLEMDPLGPLNGKNCGTTLSPWVITRAATDPFKTASPPRQQDVAAYLADSGRNALSIDLRVSISRGDEDSGKLYCQSNTSQMYWTLSQCIAHQAIAGAGLRTGDLLATGTVSGPGTTEHGCLFEFMTAGAAPPRGYIEDNETVTMSGLCVKGVGFGECVATLVAAKDLAFA